MQKWNVYGALTDNNNWQLTSLVGVHSEVSGTSAACWGRTPWGEVRMRLTSDLVLMFEHKQRPKTKKTETQFRSFTGVEISQNSSQWDWTGESYVTEGLWPSSAIPFNGWEEAEGWSGRQVVTQLVLHHRLLRREEEEMKMMERRDGLRQDRLNGDAAIRSALQNNNKPTAARKEHCLMLSDRKLCHVAPWKNDLYSSVTLNEPQLWADTQNV